MKKVFIVGDHKTGTGPANVTKQYIKYFPAGTRYQKMTSKVFRLPELIFKIFLSDIILFSGYSYQNVIGMKLARLLNKKTAYLVHGAITYENQINHEEDMHMSDTEDKTLELADRLYGVSERFSKWLKKEYPQYEDKISYAMNGVDEIDAGAGLDGLHNASDSYNADNDSDNDPGITREQKSILSIGGGMPRKRILNICRAVEILNKDSGKDNNYTLYVIGKDGYDTEAIDRYDFVKDMGLVESSVKGELFKKCGLFIQNSCFETFGLAPVEALVNGMSILVSNVCGVLDLFKNITDKDIINDCEDIEELAEKIKYAVDNPNNGRLLNDIDMDKMSWETRSKQLYEDLLTI